MEETNPVLGPAPRSRLPNGSRGINPNGTQPETPVDSENQALPRYVIIGSIFLLLLPCLILAIFSIIYAINYTNKCKDTRKKYNELRAKPCENTIVQTSSTYDQTTIEQSILETTDLNNSYSILYDNKNVDYRHSYYESLNVTNLQAWQPVLYKVYGLFLILYAVSLVVFQQNQAWTEKAKQFVLVAVLTNVYVVKMLVSLIIVCYTWLKTKLPFLFMY